MEVIHVEGVSKSYGSRRVLKDVSFSVNSNYKIGLIGQNGQGKTTLLRIIMGEERPDVGYASINPGVTVTYFEQNQRFPKGTTPNTAANIEQHILRNKTAEIEEQMSNPEIYNDSKKFQNIMDEYNALQQFRRNSFNRQRYDGILDELGFETGDMDRNLDILSCGQRTKVGIARTLATKADLTVMDEPTNHLDIEGREYLEGALKEYNGTILMVSHDRFFLDNIIDHVLEVEDATVTPYTGNYSDYIDTKRKRFESESSRYANEAGRLRQMRETEQFLLAVTKMNPNKKRGSALRNYRKKIERFEKRMTKKPVDKTQRIRIELQDIEKSNGYIYSCEDLVLGYDGVPLLTDLNLEVNRGDKIVLTGPNGHGKTTLIRAMMGEIEPMSGVQEFNKYVKMGYYDQEQLQLDPQKTVLEEAMSVQPEMSEGRMRGTLAKMLFKGDTIFQKVGKLSNGEKARVALTKMMLQYPDMLILDEPTNNLDMESANRMSDTLQCFNGTILLISHDRYFMTTLCKDLWYLSDGTVTTFKGSYQDFKKTILET